MLGSTSFNKRNPMLHCPTPSCLDHPSPVRIVWFGFVEPQQFLDQTLCCWKTGGIAKPLRPQNAVLPRIHSVVQTVRPGAVMVRLRENFQGRIVYIANTDSKSVPQLLLNPFNYNMVTTKVAGPRNHQFRIRIG